MLDMGAILATATAMVVVTVDIVGMVDMVDVVDTVFAKLRS